MLKRKMNNPTFMGVDGCKAGWFAVSLGEASWSINVYHDFAHLWSGCADADLILVDIPIGLRDKGLEERACDKEARRVLGPPRASSVFPAPCRPALKEATYQEASDLNRTLTGRGLSRQSWAISGKIREVDEFLRTHALAKSKIRECHPELLFWSLNNRTAMRHNKKKVEGYKERLAVLTNHYTQAPLIADEALDRYPRKEVARDDILDALAAAVAAYLTEGSLPSVPKIVERDSYGLPMEMVYVLLAELKKTVSL
jgi:predicted RNase H-like nuclease